MPPFTRLIRSSTYWIVACFKDAYLFVVIKTVENFKGVDRQTARQSKQGQPSKVQFDRM
jgi:hypothetical protein